MFTRVIRTGTSNSGPMTAAPILPTHHWYELGGKKMPHYVVLVKLTEKGRQNLKQAWTKDRTEAKAQVQKMGGKMTGYMTFGQYDVVELLELPDDKAAARFATMAGATGMVSTITLKAFSEDEVDKMVKESP
jgi:uncharacterized protein with GYD domain